MSRQKNSLYQKWKMQTSELEIRSVGLGMGKLHLIDLRQPHEVGMRLIAEDTRVLLCDDPECLFRMGETK